MHSFFSRPSAAAAHALGFVGAPAWLVALGLTAGTAALLDVPVGAAFYGAVVAGAAVVYLGERLAPATEDPHAHPARTAWIRRHRRTLRVTLVLAALAGLMCASLVRPPTQLAGLVLLGVGAAYAGPLVAGRRLKTIRRLKIPLIAGVWAVATVLLPLAEAGRPLGVAALALFGARALTVAANALAHDWLDRAGDAHAGVSTLPQAWPWCRVQRVAWACLALAAVLLASLTPTAGLFALVDAAGLGLFALALRRPGSDREAYGALLDLLVAWPLVPAVALAVAG